MMPEKIKLGTDLIILLNSQLFFLIKPKSIFVKTVFKLSLLAISSNKKQINVPINKA